MNSAVRNWKNSVETRLSAAFDAGWPLTSLAGELATSVDWFGCPRASQLWSPAAGYQRRVAGESPGRWWAALISWPPGHATPIHDHDGLWGVEVVLDGVLEVEAFALEGITPVTDLAGSRVLGRGDAGMFEGAGYAHRCRNLSMRRPALTLHVYGSELDRYRAFERDTDGAWASVECRVGCDRAGDDANG